MLKKLKITGFLGVLVAVLVLAVAPIASAHHATVTASLDCNGVITFTVQSWESHTSDNGGVNNDVYLQDSLGNSVPRAARRVQRRRQLPVQRHVHDSDDRHVRHPHSGHRQVGGRRERRHLQPVRDDGQPPHQLQDDADASRRPRRARSRWVPRFTTARTCRAPTGRRRGRSRSRSSRPSDSSCATPLTPAPSSGTLNGSGDATSGNFTTAAVGTYRWIAHYSGDNHYNAVDGTCNAANESSTVTKATPILSTTASERGGDGRCDSRQRTRLGRVAAPRPGLSASRCSHRATRPARIR